MKDSFKPKYTILLFFILFSTLNMYGQELKVGDRIPENIWSLPIKTLNQLNEKKTVTLGNYRGKLIILNFWATWCGPCVGALPKVQHLQKSFGNEIQIIPITIQNDTTVSSFFRSNAIGKSLVLSTAYNDSSMKKIFPHKYLSHLVWIDKNGFLKATTWSEYLTIENIKSILEGKPQNWMMKNDMLLFDKNIPLLRFSDTGAAAPESNWHSSISSRLDGVDIASGVVANQENKTIRRFEINASIRALCVRAWNKPLPMLTPKQFVYEVADINRYVRPDSVPLNVWNHNNTYCYESIMPISFTKEKLGEILKQDLRRYLNVEGYVEKRLMKCLVISRSDKSTENSNKEQKNGLSVENLVWKLNEKSPSIPLAINDSGVDKKIYIKPESYSNIEILLAELKKAGIRASLEHRAVDVFVIKEIFD